MSAFNQGKAAFAQGLGINDNPYLEVDENDARAWASGLAHEMTNWQLAKRPFYSQSLRAPEGAATRPQFCVIAPLLTNASRPWFPTPGRAAEHGAKLLAKPGGSTQLVVVQALQMVERTRPAPPPIEVRDLRPGDLR